MTLVLMQQAWRAVGGIPADDIVNTMHFDVTATTPLVAADIKTAVDNFWSAVGQSPAAFPIRDYLSGETLTGGGEQSFYDLTLPAPRIPFHQASFSYTLAAASAMPSEVALVNSFRAADQPGVPGGRIRNRFYIGVPTTGAAAETDANGRSRPSINFRNAVVGASKALKAASDAAVTWTWVVHSRVAGTAWPVNSGWVDNAWDTMRSRGPDSSVRIIW